MHKNSTWSVRGAPVLGAQEMSLTLSGATPEQEALWSAVFGWLASLPVLERSAAIEGMAEVLKRKAPYPPRVSYQPIEEELQSLRCSFAVATDTEPEPSDYLDALFSPADRQALLRGER